MHENEPGPAEAVDPGRCEWQLRGFRCSLAPGHAHSGYSHSAELSGGAVLTWPVRHPETVHASCAQPDPFEEWLAESQEWLAEARDAHVPFAAWDEDDRRAHELITGLLEAWRERSRAQRFSTEAGAPLSADDITRLRVFAGDIPHRPLSRTATQPFSPELTAELREHAGEYVAVKGQHVIASSTVSYTDVIKIIRAAGHIADSVFRVPPHPESGE